MLDISNSTTSAFREPPGSATAALVPTFSIAPLAGGIGFARIGARFMVDGKPYIVRNQDAVERRFPKIKTVARCIGMLRQTEILPCGCAHADTIDALIAAHPSLDILKQRNEVHVIAGWSSQPWDEESHGKALKTREKFMKQLTELEDQGRMLDAQALRAKLGWGEGYVREPEKEIVGLFIASASAGKWLHSHDDR